MANCEYATFKEIKDVRSILMSILNAVQRDLKHADLNYKYSGFSVRVVGSAKYNMVIKRGDSTYDTDLEIYFNANNAKELPPEIKLDIYQYIKNILPDKWTIEISTSVITIKNIKDSKLVHSFDIAIIRKRDDKFEIVKGKDTDQHEFRWETLKAYNKTLNKFKNATHKQVLKIKEIYKELKCNQPTNKSDKNYKPSQSLFIEAINQIIK